MAQVETREITSDDLFAPGSIEEWTISGRIPAFYTGNIGGETVVLCLIPPSGVGFKNRLLPTPDRIRHFQSPDGTVHRDTQVIVRNPIPNLAESLRKRVEQALLTIPVKEPYYT